MCEQTELRPLEEDATWRCSVVCEQTELRPLEEDATWRCGSNSFGMRKKKSGEDFLFLRSH